MGADPAAAAPRSLCGPGRPRRLWPRLIGRDVYRYWLVQGRRRSPLARGSVGSAGGVRTQVRAGAERAVLTRPAGPGPGESRGFCAASRPGRRSGRHRQLGGSGVRRPASVPRVRSPSLAPGWVAELGPSASALSWTRGSQFPSRGRQEVSESRFSRM